MAKDCRTHGVVQGLWRGAAASLRSALVLLARLYQRTLSPLVPFHCRFQPSCSQYFIEAVSAHGAWRGAWLGLWRILRCQPLCRGGEDPVPAKRPARS